MVWLSRFKNKRQPEGLGLSFADHQDGRTSAGGTPKLVAGDTTSPIGI